MITCTTDERGVSQLTLNRPDKHNAFNDEVIGLLLDALDSLQREGRTRVLVLASVGRSFCAGADLNWMKKSAQYTTGENRQDAAQLATMLARLNSFPAPTLARVQGATMGGGVGLAACCDIVVSSSMAKFSLSEVRIGLIPATISPFVIDAIGARNARRYFLSAEIFSAHTAREVGLVHEVVEPDDLDQTVEQLINQLLTGGPEAQRAAKVLISDLQYAKRDAELAQSTAQLIADIRASDEGREGIAAFLEKRKPDWQTG